MEYPHRKYLLYLLSRKMEAADIRADCLTKGLIPPDDVDLTRIHHHDLGEIPTFWRARVTRENVKFRRWLRDKGVLYLWQRDAAVEKAFELLYRPEVRKDFEAIILVHGDVSQARRELQVKHLEFLIPEETALMRFYDIFWDVGAMTRYGIMEYISAEEARSNYIPALQGDLVTTYGILGLQQKIRGETFLQNLVEMANQQALITRNMPHMSGQMKAGTSALMKLGLEAHKILEDRHIIEAEGGSLRDQAADFLARVVEDRQIPSIDEIERGDVIDAEYAEAGNVHRLPVRHDP